ncbi:hypothetical protein HYR99_15995 [Candidatus Poribacteria bacterium]|nr:hypothetical protein [Candidatus Poribacteria bacterium]
MKKFETQVKLSREMTLMDATLIGVGAMIGAGIFVLTGIAAGVAGPALILAFALNGIVALFTLCLMRNWVRVITMPAGAICGSRRGCPNGMDFYPAG